MFGSKKYKTMFWLLKKLLERKRLALQPRGKALAGSCDVFLLREN